MMAFVQVATLICIVVIVASYKQQGARFRLGVSALTGLILAGCASMACAIATGRMEPHPALLLGSLIILALVARARGDVAALLNYISAR